MWIWKWRFDRFRKNMILRILFLRQEHLFPNSISELYTMMNYIQPEYLKTLSSWLFWLLGRCFWRNSKLYGISSYRDKYQPKKRFKKLSIYLSWWKSIKKQLDIQNTRYVGFYLVPEAHIIPIESELTENQKLYLEELVMRSDMVQMWNSWSEPG